MRSIWVLIGGGLFLAASGWAIYASSFYLFLARAFPTPARVGPQAAMASIQAYAVAFGPLGILVVGATIWLLRRRKAGRAPSQKRID